MNDKPKNFGLWAAKKYKKLLYAFHKQQIETWWQENKFKYFPNETITNTQEDKTKNQK
jgi:hypothetical protein